MASKWPYTDYQTLNLDWIISKVKNINSDAAAASAAAEEAADSASAAQLDAQTASGAADRAEAAAASIASGSPVVVTLAADMTDTDLIYLYEGSETGYNPGEWYYYDGQDWVSGGTYGAGMISSGARTLLEYILNGATYEDPNMKNYIQALIEALRINGPVQVLYSVSYNLTNASSSNTSSDIIENMPYTTTISANASYYLEDVTVTMGGVDITSSVYANGSINIPAVTGNIIITAVTSGPWSQVWDYSMGLPENNGFLKEQTGTATITQTSEGLHLVLPSTSGCLVRYKYDLSAYTTPCSRMVSEVRFKVSSWSQQSSAGLRHYAGLGGTSSNGVKCMELLISDNPDQSGLSWLATAAGWTNMSTAVPSTGVEHTCKLVQVPGSCQVYIDGSLVDTITDIREIVTLPQIIVNRQMDIYLISYKIYVEV